MEGIGTRSAIANGALKHLAELRCEGCGKCLLFMATDALRPEKAISVKCTRCNFITVRIGIST